MSFLSWRAAIRYPSCCPVTHLFLAIFIEPGGVISLFPEGFNLRKEIACRVFFLFVTVGGCVAGSFQEPGVPSFRTPGPTAGLQFREFALPEQGGPSPSLEQQNVFQPANQSHPPFPRRSRRAISLAAVPDLSVESPSLFSA